ncbi:lipase 3-like [Aphis craccivora]|uniref:Lipase 3-like n=1 Tax=Aphis craccivora TaxID=307492 RepID=A0A6G0YYC5_APHCR|nr:lipase 3-like [Aphis craccivora]
MLKNHTISIDRFIILYLRNKPFVQQLFVNLLLAPTIIKLTTNAPTSSAMNLFENNSLSTVTCVLPFLNRSKIMKYSIHTATKKQRPFTLLDSTDNCCCLRNQDSSKDSITVYIISIKSTNSKFTHFLTIVEIIQNNGYDVEIHNVITADGYILELHRIPRSKRGQEPTRNHPILIHHGILGTSADWVLAGAGMSLPMQLADDGYDVWLANCRGNTYSRKHISMTYKQKSFWNFSRSKQYFLQLSYNNYFYTIVRSRIVFRNHLVYDVILGLGRCRIKILSSRNLFLFETFLYLLHEVGKYDIPATIDYILSTTNTTQLHYIGYSMGSCVFFIMASERPEYQPKIRSQISLAPVAFLSNTRSSLRFMAPYAKMLNVKTFIILKINHLFYNG